MKSKIKTQMNVEFVVTLTEEEARALEAVCGYGPQQFLSVFYKYMGRSYLQPHEEGFISLCEGVTDKLKPLFTQIEKAKNLL